jgi:hypothetical protein
VRQTRARVPSGGEFRVGDDGGRGGAGDLLFLDGGGGHRTRVDGGESARGRVCFSC